jgi:hypothetical protein
MRCLALVVVVSALVIGAANLCTAAEEESTKPEGAESLSAKGTVAAVSGEGVQLKVSDTEGWLVEIRPGETKIEVTGTAEPTYLRSGMHVRFVGEIDAKGNLEGDISEIEVFTPRGKNDLGLFNENDKGSLAKPLRKFAAGKYQIRGKITSLKEHDIVVLAGKKVTGTVAEVVQVKVTSDELDNVHEGDEVSVTGWYYPANKAADKKPGQAVADQLSITLAKPIAVGKKPARAVAKTAKSKPSKNKDKEMDDSEEGGAAAGPLISDPFGIDKK